MELLCINNGKYFKGNWHKFLDNCYVALDATNIDALKLLAQAKYSNKKSTIRKSARKPDVLVVITLRKAFFILSKQQGINFTLKKDMTCESSDLVYVVICPTCNEEYIGETGEGKARDRDNVQAYGQHICQPQYQQLKCEELVEKENSKYSLSSNYTCTKRAV